MLLNVFLLNLQNSIIGKKNKKCKEALTAHLILKIQPTSGLLFAVFDMWQTQKYLKAASFSVCIELSKETLCAKNSERFLRYPPPRTLTLPKLVGQNWFKIMLAAE